MLSRQRFPILCEQGRTLLPERIYKGDAGRKEMRREGDSEPDGKRYYLWRVCACIALTTRRRARGRRLGLRK